MRNRERREGKRIRSWEIEDALEREEGEVKIAARMTAPNERTTPEKKGTMKATHTTRRKTIRSSKRQNQNKPPIDRTNGRGGKPLEKWGEGE
jgi:hypothetical protein